VLRQDLRRSQQHGHMAVMSASMHFTIDP
jgi:hypothetical protein